MTQEPQNERLIKGEAQASHELFMLLGNSGLDEMVELFQEQLPDEKPERLDALQNIAASHWDFRKDVERQAVNWDETHLSDPDSPEGHIVFEAAAKLGMVESSAPKREHYDFLVIPGAANKAPWQRLKYALEQGVTYDQIVLLGCDRAVSDAERENAIDYASDNPQTEFDLMCAAAEKELDLIKPNDEPGDELYEETQLSGVDRQKEGRVRRYLTREGNDVLVFSTFPIAGEQRANTSDSYRLMRFILGNQLGPQSSVLLSTNAFYKPFQHLDALRDLTLPSGAYVETIGFDAAYGGVSRKPSQLLQEAKSAINSAAKLSDALAEAK